MAVIHVRYVLDAHIDLKFESAGFCEIMKEIDTLKTRKEPTTINSTHMTPGPHSRYRSQARVTGECEANTTTDKLESNNITSQQQIYSNLSLAVSQIWRVPHGLTLHPIFSFATNKIGFLFYLLTQGLSVALYCKIASCRFCFSFQAV